MCHQWNYPKRMAKGSSGNKKKELRNIEKE